MGARNAKPSAGLPARWRRCKETVREVLGRHTVAQVIERENSTVPSSISERRWDGDFRAIPTRRCGSNADSALAAERFVGGGLRDFEKASAPGSRHHEEQVETSGWELSSAALLGLALATILDATRAAVAASNRVSSFARMKAWASCACCGEAVRRCEDRPRRSCRPAPFPASGRRSAPCLP